MQGTDSEHENKNELWPKRPLIYLAVQLIDIISEPPAERSHGARRKAGLTEEGLSHDEHCECIGKGRGGEWGGSDEEIMEKGPLTSEWGTQERAAEYEICKELEETE